MKALRKQGFTLKLSNGRRIDLATSKSIESSAVPGLHSVPPGGPIAIISSHPTDPNVKGLQNRSHVTWRAYPLQGNRIEVKPGKNVRLAHGTRIDFGSTQGQIEASKPGSRRLLMVSVAVIILIGLGLLAYTTGAFSNFKSVIAARLQKFVSAKSVSAPAATAQAPAVQPDRAAKAMPTAVPAAPLNFIQQLPPSEATAVIKALSPEAQKSFNRGLEAAARQQWDVAIHEFGDAKILAGDDRRILVNLGLANSKAGNELTALGLLNAYVAISPQGNTAASARAEIESLKTRLKERVRKLFVIAKNALDKLTVKHDLRSYSIQKIGEQQAEIGDFESARQSFLFAHDAKQAEDTARGYGISNERRDVDPDMLRKHLCRSLLDERAFSEADVALDEISDQDVRDQVLEDFVLSLVSGSTDAEKVGIAERYFARISQSAKASPARTPTYEEKSQTERKDQVAQELAKAKAKVGSRQSSQGAEGDQNPLAKKIDEQLNAGNFDGALQSAEASPNASEKASNLESIIMGLYKANQRSRAAGVARQLLALESQYLAEMRAKYQQDKVYRDPETVFNWAKAVAKASLGESQSAIRSSAEEAGWGSFNFTWAGDPNLLGFYCSGVDSRRETPVIVAFIFAMNGQQSEAMRMAREIDGEGGHWPHGMGAIAYAAIIKGDLSEGLRLIGSLQPPRGEKGSYLHHKSQLLGLVLLGQMKHGDMQGSAHTLALFPSVSEWETEWAEGLQYIVEAKLARARVYHDRGNNTASNLEIDETKKLIDDARKNADLQKKNPNSLAPLLERVAIEQEKNGDTASASRTRNEKPATGDTKSLQPWLDILDQIDKWRQSRGYSNTPEITKGAFPTDDVVSKYKGEATYAANQISETARDMGVWLRKLERLEGKKTSWLVATSSSSSNTTQQIEIKASKEKPFVNSLGMKFVPVPDTKALFSIWDTRVQDYEAFVTATGRSWGLPSFDQNATHPAVNISWDDAKAFCKWLTEKEHKEGKLGTGSEYRLPTDIEWSKAAGGLGYETGGKPAKRSGEVRGIYPWGSQWPPPAKAGNYSGEEAGDYSVIKGYKDDFRFTAPVGSFPQNSFGLYDMGGNVWQWVEDWYDAESPYRVLRGGSYKDNEADKLLSSYRDKAPPDRTQDTVGFRCVIASPSP